MDQDEARRAKVTAAKKKLKKFQSKRTGGTEGSVGKTHGRSNSTTSSVSSVVSGINRTNDSYHGMNLSPYIQNTHDLGTAAAESDQSVTSMLSPDIRMASELFNNSRASNEFADVVPNHNDEEIERLTQRIRDLESNERINETSLNDLNVEYQKAVNQLKKFDPKLIVSTQKQLEEARHVTTQLRERLFQEEQKVESMEYEISGLRQKLSIQEEKSGQLKDALDRSEEESKEYGDLLILSNQRADELEETFKSHQEKVNEYKQSKAAAENSLQRAKQDILERDILIAELRQSSEDLSYQVQNHKRESSNATKQLKSLSEKAAQLGKENRTLIERLEDMRQTSINLETENSAIREQIQNASSESEKSANATDVIELQQRLSETEESLKACRMELEQEKQRNEDLADRPDSSKMNGHNIDDEKELEKPLRTLQTQLDVERQKSREILGQLETIRGEMAELRRRYMFILEENKQLNELVEAEVFEGDEFGAGMKDYEVNGDTKFTPDTALSPGQYASYDYERSRIIKRARASLLKLQEKAIQDPSLRQFELSPNGIGSERSSSSFDSYRKLINSSLPPRVKPQHQPFMDVPKCSGCLGSAVEV